MSAADERSSKLVVEELKESVKYPIWTLFRRHIQSHLPLLGVSVSARLLRFALQPIPFFLVGVAFDTIFVPEHPYRLPLVPAAWIPEGQLPQLWFTFWILVAYTLFGAGRMIVSTLATQSLTHRIQHDVRTDVYDTAQQLQMSFFDANQTGDVMSVLNDDVSTLGGFVSNGVQRVVQTFGQLGGYLVLMALINWQLMLVTMAVAPVIVYLNLRFRDLLGEIYGELRERVGDLNARIQTNISGISVIKTARTEDLERERVTEESRELRDSHIDALRVSARYWPATGLLAGFAYLVTFAVGGYWIIVGPPLFFTAGLTPGGLVTFLLYTNRVRWPIQQASGILDSFKRAQAAAARVVALEAADITLPEPADPATLGKVAGRVTFEHVTFAYAGRDEPAVEAIDFDIEPGETVGLVGPTGAGKSTLMKLLLRFYDVDTGAVRIDGVDVRDIPLQELRSATGYVSQDPFLFSGTVWANIGYGSPGASQTAIERAAKLAGAHEFIRELPNEYRTEVGERGVKLSGGQRQRIAIARAFLRDPPILVLDEATSHVDNETEAQIQEGIASLISDRTAFVIAHRLSTVKQADRIIVLDEGRVVEQGTHAELLERDGLYANLWNVQVGEVESLPDEFLARVEELEEINKG